MRIKAYRQRIDLFKVTSEDLRLTEINITSPEDSLSTKPTDSARLADLVRANLAENKGLTSFQISRKVPFQFFCTFLEQDYPIRLNGVEVEKHCIKLGFHIIDDDAEADNLTVKVPFGNTDGRLRFASSPLREETESYEIVWRNGNLLAIAEAINDHSYFYYNITSDADAKLGSFDVKEIE